MILMKDLSLNQKGVLRTVLYKLHDRMRRENWHAGLFNSNAKMAIVEQV
jgi:hypothetical protein